MACLILRKYSNLSARSIEEETNPKFTLALIEFLPCFHCLNGVQSSLLFLSTSPSQLERQSYTGGPGLNEAESPYKIELCAV